MTEFTISTITMGQGAFGISPLPGRYGDIELDADMISNWGAQLVISMTPHDEMRQKGASNLPDALQKRGIKWMSVPVVDFGSPDADTDVVWSATAPFAHQIVSQGGRVLVHCFGGCGRSGMAVLRLMVELGADGETALERLREQRPCAVETDAQTRWALRA
jgi:protein-tyrosine phosphatase